DLGEWTFNNFKEACAKDLSDEEVEELRQQVEMAKRSSLPKWKINNYAKAFEEIKALRKGAEQLRTLSFDISANPGVALIEVKKGKPTLLAVDHLETDAKHTDAQRYAIIEAWATQFIYDNRASDAQVIREKFIK